MGRIFAIFFANTVGAPHVAAPYSVTGVLENS